MKFRQDLTLRKIGEDHIIVNPNQGMVDMTSIIKLNESAVFIWESLQGKSLTTDSISELLLANYHVTTEIATRDAEEFLKTFQEKGLLED